MPNPTMRKDCLQEFLKLQAELHSFNAKKPEEKLEQEVDYIIARLLALEAKLVNHRAFRKFCISARLKSERFQVNRYATAEFIARFAKMTDAKLIAYYRRLQPNFPIAIVQAEAEAVPADEKFLLNEPADVKAIVQVEGEPVAEPELSPEPIIVQAEAEAIVEVESEPMAELEPVPEPANAIAIVQAKVETIVIMEAQTEADDQAEQEEQAIDEEIAKLEAALHMLKARKAVQELTAKHRAKLKPAPKPKHCSIFRPAKIPTIAHAEDQQEASPEPNNCDDGDSHLFIPARAPPE